MNSREAVIEEIRTAPEPVVEEVLDFVKFLKSKPTVKQPATITRAYAREVRGIVESRENLNAGSSAASFRLARIDFLAG